MIQDFINRLDDVNNWYETIYETQIITKLFIKNNPDKVSQNSKFIGMTLEEVKNVLSDIKLNLDDLAILSLVTSFEGSILEYLTNEINSTSVTNPFLKKVFEETAKKAERWKFEDILDLFKELIDSKIVGNAKIVYQYRNKVAHRKEKSASLTPNQAYTYLLEFLKRLPDPESP